MTTEKFEQWCIIGLFGHQKLAGLVTEKNLGGASFLQVDVPETESQPAFTRIINPTAVYDINPVTKEVAVAYAQNLHVKPIESWDIRKVMEKVEQNKLALAVKSEPSEVDFEDDDDNSGEYNPGEAYERSRATEPDPQE